MGSMLKLSPLQTTVIIVTVSTRCAQSLVESFTNFFFVSQLIMPIPVLVVKVHPIFKYMDHACCKIIAQLLSGKAPMCILNSLSYV